MNFHQFPSPSKNKENEENILFTYLKNREKGLDKSGINNLYSLLSTEYDNVDNAVSTTLKHKIVFDKIEKLSNRNISLPDESERFESKKKSLVDNTSFSSVEAKFDGNFESKKERNQKKEDIENKNYDNQKKEELPFVEISDLMNSLNKDKKESEENFDKEQVENILEDLHKLGLIVYFKKEFLKDTIISNPQWFNKV